MFEALNVELVRLTGEGLYEDQRACLLDHERREEALDMLDDMEARIGVSHEVCAALIA